MPEYTVARNVAGSYEFTTSQGVAFSEDPRDEKYSAFLHWLSMQPDPHGLDFDGQPPHDAYFFGDMSQLVEHLKKWQAFLYVSRGATHVRGTVESNQTITFGNNSFLRLPVADLHREDPEFIRPLLNYEERSGLVSKSSQTFVTQDVLDDINRYLSEEPTHPIRRLSSWPIRRTFVYLDVSDFSKAKSGHQALIIRAIISLVQKDVLWARAYGLVERVNRPEAMLCIGDGYIFVFEAPRTGAFFAAYLAQLIERSIAKGDIVEFHFRMGVHVGRVFSFWDPGRDSWNYSGDGINGGNRVISAIGKDADDIVFISAQVRNALLGDTDAVCPEILRHSQNRGRRPDKHGNFWRVYELNHAGLTDYLMPEELAQD